MGGDGAVGVIAATATPALFILAASSLAASALVRMAHVVDRARALTAIVHEGRLEKLGATPATARRWLGAQRSRALRTARAVASLNLAIVLFVGACLVLGSQQIGAGLPGWTPLVFVLPGTLLLLGAAIWMAGETVAGQAIVIEEIEIALALWERTPDHDLRAAETRRSGHVTR